MIGRVLLGLLTAFMLSIPGLPVSHAQAMPDPEFPARPVDAPAACDPDTSYFYQTGHTLSSQFRDYWQKNGGVSIFGYALTEPFFENIGPNGVPELVQYFERARFELPIDPVGAPVQLGLLGNWATQGRSFPTVGSFPDTSDVRYFPETGHSLGYGFKHYWESNGGLSIFGFPVSEEIQEGGYTVQYFQRARFEYHPEYAGTPYEVLLGLLGSQAAAAHGWTTTAPAVDPPIFGLEARTQTAPQGGLTEVRVCAGEALHPVGHFAGRDFSLTRSGSYYVGLVGVAPWDNPGTQVLAVTFWDGAIPRTLSTSVNVTAVDFPVQELVVPSDRTGLLDPAVGQAEMNIVNPVLNTYTPQQFWTGPFIWPVNGEITTQFGEHRSYNGGAPDSYHAAYDIAAPEGTFISADASGYVRLAQRLQIRGNAVYIDHGMGVYTAYYHLSRIDVQPGQWVNKGEIIGLVGNTGLSTGPHLHWEIRVDNAPVDPKIWASDTISTNW